MTTSYDKLPKLIRNHTEYAKEYERAQQEMVRADEAEAEVERLRNLYEPTDAG